MQLKAPLKLAFSFSTRRIRLGVAHHGSPAPIAPLKGDASTKLKPKKR